MNNLPINQIICGDCLDVMKEFPNKSIDHVIVDIPFFNIIKDTWDNIWESEKDYLMWVEKLIEQYYRILRIDGNIFIFTGRQQNRKIAMLLDQFFIEKRIIIWVRKRNFNQTRGTALASNYEPICYYSYGQNGIFHNLKIKSDSLRKEYVEGSLANGITLSDVWSDISALPHNSKEKVKHPTQKPVKLIERIILLGTNEGDIVLDNCAGSFTTAVACDNLNRKWICIEKEEEYCEVGLRRVNENRKILNKELVGVFC